jgi:hypothetical protein
MKEAGPLGRPLSLVRGKPKVGSGRRDLRYGKVTTVVSPQTVLGLLSESPT